MLLLLSLACDDHIFTSAGGGGGAVTGDSYTDVVAIFDGACISCHSAASASSFGNLDLETDPCAALVGVQAFAYDAPLVAAGDSAGSVLWHKVANTGTYGGIMPLGGELAPESVDTIASWIDAGASCDDGTGGTGGTTPPGTPTGTGGDDSGTAGTDDSGTAAPLTIQAIQDQVFTPVCAECHVAGAGAAFENLDLSSATAAYADLVNFPSSKSESGLDLVEPGRPDQSFLVKKLTGDLTFNERERMPQGRTPLDQELIDLVEQWITEGALP